MKTIKPFYISSNEESTFLFKNTVKSKRKDCLSGASALPGQDSNQICLIQFNLTVKMSYYRQSPPHYSRRSPPRGERELIEEEINLKNALRSEAQNRRLLDEISLLQIKLRKTDQLQLKNDALIKQNSMLTQDNDQLARELSERRYELERLKANTVQLQERDAIKTTQLSEVNRSLELEIELLKKERLESNKLYEAHIQKLEYMLEDKIKELDVLTIKCNDLINAREASEIRFEEEKNKLKNLMARTNHDMERELEYTKEKNSTEKTVEVETLKKNYTSQILLLEDEINKLKAANDYKHNQFENQLAENKNLRNRHENEIKSLELENTGLREKILKLEELNRSEVVNIEVKYRDLQQKETTSILSGHDHEIKTLMAEIDRQNWLLRDKNKQIQNMIREKKQQKIQEEERELAFRAEIDTLKNKLEVQSDRAAQENQENNRRIINLASALQRDSDSYHDRVNQLNQNINNLESELNSRQNQLDRNKAENNLKAKEQRRNIDELSDKLDRTRRDLRECEKDRQTEKNQNQQFRDKTYNEISDLTKKNRELETQREELSDKLQRANDSSGDNEKILRNQIAALKKNIAILEKNLSDQQSRHAQEMADLTANLKEKLEKLKEQQRRTVSQLEDSKAQEVNVLNSRWDKANRDREQANKKLAEYVKMFTDLDKHFKNPAEGSICRERGESNLYETLQKVTESVLNIF